MDAGKITTTQEAAAVSAAEMGYGAVKYFDLRQHPTTSYVFRCHDRDLMICHVQQHMFMLPLPTCLPNHIVTMFLLLFV